ncbi:MAG: molybdopterin cofactor-binding domain-containing protein, partial [Candidatus Caldarchaeum sp.]
LRYVIVHDVGKAINPLIVDGQIVGGLSNGLGAALLEEIIHDENGQPLAATLADYLIPTAVEMPREIEIEHFNIPSPLNPLGIKGVGESGVIPSMAVVASAVQDALDNNVVPKESPLTPMKLWRLQV